MDYQIIESIIDPSALIYAGARVKKSTLGAHVVVGNFSRVDFCQIEDRVRIDRNNHIFKSRIGRNTYTGMNTVLMNVNIGSFCSISWNVSIGGANHDYTRVVQHSLLYNNHDNLRPDYREIPYDRFNESLDIGSDVWVAAGAVILPGLKIGHGAVIGANSVVTHDVPPYAIVVGSPVKIVRWRFDSEIIELLLRLEWWQWEEAKILDNFDILSSQPDVKRLKSLLAGQSVASSD
jgi:virginiamycin A acetyltransferase